MDALHLQSFLNQIKQWKAEGLVASQIQTRLEQMQLTQEQLSSILQEWKRIRTAKKGIRVLFMQVLEARLSW